MLNDIIKIKRIYESALRYIRNEDKLSKEASLEELCKLILLKFCYEQKNQYLLVPDKVQLFAFDEYVQDGYRRWFYQYLPAEQFYGWDTIRVSKDSFIAVLKLFKELSFTEIEKKLYGEGFTEFLQSQYTGYLSESASPRILTKYLFSVIETAKITSLFDPCCGLGGMLAEAAKGKHPLVAVAGWDTNRRILNTAKLHLMMYGCRPDDIVIGDLAKKNSTGERYGCIVAHLPRVVQQNFSIAGQKDVFFEDQREFTEDVMIKNIVTMLSPNGIAAIVVSDELLENYNRNNSRKWIYENCQLLNITKFEGLAYYGGSIKNPYNVLFLRKSYYPSEPVCTVTFIRKDADEDEIREVAGWVNEWVYTNSISKEEARCKMFNLSGGADWNITLLFLHDLIGDKYKQVALREILESTKERAEIVPTVYYKQLRVKSKGMGVEQRDEPVKGEDFKTKELAFAHAGELVVSALEADNAAIGIVPKELDGAVVTRNFLLFRFDEDKVDPDYLYLVLCSDTIQEQIRLLHKHDYAMSRISISKIQSVVIPLPDLETQRMMVKPLMASIKKVQKAQEEMVDKLDKFNKDLFG